MPLRHCREQLFVIRLGHRRHCCDINGMVLSNMPPRAQTEIGGRLCSDLRGRWCVVCWYF